MYRHNGLRMDRGLDGGVDEGIDGWSKVWIKGLMKRDGWMDGCREK